MLKNLKILNWICCCSLFLACSSKDNNKVVIQFSKDSTSVVISNIDIEGYYALEAKQKKGESFEEIVSVLESPGEDDSLAMEKEFPGRLTLKDKQVVFKPSQPFIKGKQYIVSTLMNTSLGGSKDMLSGKLNPRASRTQKTLIR